MRISIVHSEYRSSAPSGENTTVLRQVDLLRHAGHSVQTIIRRSDDYVGQRFFTARAGLRTASGFGPSPMDELRTFQPDVVHVHNLFPNFGERWLERCEWPVVATLHNYRPLCANGLLFRDGHLCLDCPSGHPSSSLRHRCYRGSAVTSIPHTVRLLRGAANAPLIKRADALVVPSQLTKEIYARAGVPRPTLRVIPSSVPANPFVDLSSVGHGWVVVGRVSEEKGVVEVISEWPEDLALDVIGDGPELLSAKARAGSNVRFLGRLSEFEIQRRMPRYCGLIFPSLSYETQGLVVGEALSAGIPVVANRINSGASTVVQLGCGYSYSSVAELHRMVSRVEQEGLDLRREAHAAYQRAFSNETWIQSITSLYESLAAPPP